MMDLNEALKETIEGLANMAKEERRKSESYKDMFKEVPGDNFEGLLRDVERRMIGVVLDACEVINQKTGKHIDKELFNVLKAFPFVQDRLERIISEKEGPCCCVDKSYYLLNQYLKQHLK